MMKILLLLLTLLPIASSFPYGTQSIRVTGRLLCRGKPAPFVEMSLVNSRGAGENNEDLANGVFTDPDGYFEMAGSMHQFYLIPAQIFMWHECFYDIGIHHGNCKSLKKVDVPEEFVVEGSLPRVTWNAGEIHLEHSVLKENLEKCK